MSSSDANDHGKGAERGGADRARDRRSGEGSESALANLKKLERERERARPADEHGDAQG